MTTFKILPEACYDLTDLSREDVTAAFNKNETITGYVEDIQEKNEKLLVKLGHRLYGYLPFSEVTPYTFIYTSKPGRYLPVQIYTLFHKKIRVKVTYVDNATISLSRKANMLEATNYLKENKDAILHITSMLPAVVFGDIGDGVVGRLSIKHISRVRIKSTYDYFSPGENIKVKILEPAQEDYGFFVSHVQAFKKYDPYDYHNSEVVSGIIRDPLDSKNDAYYVDIAPNVSSIMDVTDNCPPLSYGDKVLCYVKQAGPKGLHLRFLALDD